MNNPDAIKAAVREKYASIAEQSKSANEKSCCGVGPEGTYTIMSDAYTHLPGYNPDADLGLGCGLPTEYAQIAEGDTVIDLGSGAGNDCFVARAETGPTGKVIGIDFTPEMINKARENAEKLGFNNVEFRFGDIEDMPVSSNSVDVAVSNCVLNLAPNKQGVFAELKRVLKPGGHFSISDVVITGQLPQALRESAEMYAGCVAGAIDKEEYLKLIEEAGFENIIVQKQKPILIPDEILLAFFSKEQVEAFVQSGAGIFSITVYAEKPGGTPRIKEAKPKINLAEIGKKEPCCAPGSGCC